MQNDFLFAITVVCAPSILPISLDVIAHLISFYPFQAVANCEPLISDLHVFTKAEPIWKDVAHRGKLIEYVKH